jgi:hypothetical protein
MIHIQYYEIMNQLTICFSRRINKRGSQKDSEQKSNGNYFFYEEIDSSPDVDDDDL